MYINGKNLDLFQVDFNIQNTDQNVHIQRTVQKKLGRPRPIFGNQEKTLFQRQHKVRSLGKRLADQFF